MSDRQNPFSAVRALIVKEDKLLLVNGDGDGDFYCLPGGRIDFGEDLISAVKREVYEETGLDIAVGPAVFVYDFLHQAKNFHVVNTVFRCEVINGNLSDDWQDSGGPVWDRRFVSLEEMKDLKVFPENLREGEWLKVTQGSGFYQGQEKK